MTDEQPGKDEQPPLWPQVDGDVDGEPDRQDEDREPAGQAETVGESTTVFPAITAEGDREEEPDEEPGPRPGEVTSVLEPVRNLEEPGHEEPGYDEPGYEDPPTDAAVRPVEPSRPEPRRHELPGSEPPRYAPRPPEPPRPEPQPRDVPNPVEGPTRMLPLPEEDEDRYLPTERAMPVRIEPAGEAAEEHRDEHEGDHDHPEDHAEDWEPEQDRPKPKRRKRGLVITAAVVVVILLAAGALVGVPGLADRIGVPLPSALRGTDAPPEPIAVQRQLRGLSGGKSPSAQAVNAALAKVTSNPALAKLTGMVVDPRTGDTLWQQGPGTPSAPGSTEKLLTAAAAVLQLDPDTRFTTKVVQGNDPSTAVLVGGGDPTINSLPAGRDSVYWNAPRLSDLVAQVRKASGGRIKTVRIDESRYTGDSAAKGWDKADIQAGNYTPIVPAILDGGRTDPTMAEQTPRTPNPGKDLLAKFAGGIGASAAGEGSAPKNAKVLGEIRSAPLKDLVANLLTISDNVLAETVGRELAIATGHPPTFEGAVAAVRQVLTRNGFDISGMNTVDCSGLSTQDRVPAQLIASVLGAATGEGRRAGKLRPILDGLPIAGGTGTLQNRYQSGPSEQGRGWVRAKTGTLTAVSALAGYVQTKDNQVLAFSFMSNGGDLAQQKPALDAIAATLRDCGCG